MCATMQKNPEAVYEIQKNNSVFAQHRNDHRDVPSLVMAETEEPMAEDAADIYEDQAEQKAGDSITWKLEDGVLLQSS